jgi:lysophospholipase L1-like esterase
MLRGSAAMAAGRVLVVAVAGLLAAASPARAQADDRFIVSGMGDSVAAGFGLHSTRLENALCKSKMPYAGCDFASEGWPALFAKGLTANDTDGARVDAYNWSISGSRPGDWLGLGRKKMSPSIATWFKSIQAEDPDVIAMSIGANDLLVDLRCARKPSCARGLLARARTRETVHELLSALVENTGADILLMLYYRPTLDRKDVVRELNSQLRSAAQGFDGQVIVVSPPDWSRHGCGRGVRESWMLGFSWDLCSHPNKLGQERLARAALAAWRAADGAAAARDGRASQSGRRCGSFVDFVYETPDLDQSNIDRWRIRAHQVGCARADRIIRAYHFRGVVPRGWECASSDAEAGCWRGPSSESGPRASVGIEKSLGRRCNIGALYATTGVGLVWHHRLSCRRVKRIMRRWGQEPHPRSDRPGGFRCRTFSPNPDGPGPVRYYWCRKGVRLMRFAVGG